MTDHTTRRILVAEDDEVVGESMVERISLYPMVEARFSHTASATLAELKTWTPDVLILDLMMPYGAVDDSFRRGDLHEVETGIRLLDHIRRGRAEGVPQDLWVVVITARSAIGVIREVERSLGRTGRIFQKPFENATLEHMLAELFGLQSKVNEVLIPLHYTSPEPLPPRGDR